MSTKNADKLTLNFEAMGQAQSTSECAITDALDAAHMQVVRHAKVLSEINSLTYEDFKTCLNALNEL